MRYTDLTGLVMHVRDYRESSAIVQFFTEQQGRLAGVMKGMRRGRNPVQVQPFSLARLSCVGRSNLMTVTQFEVTGRFDLHGDALSAGFYVLELLSRALAERQIEVGVFRATLEVLARLAAGEGLSPCLRSFEARLLNELGFGLDYLHDAGSGAEIQADTWYDWVPEQGFYRSEAVPGEVQGWMLQAMSNMDFSDPQVARAARKLNQRALQPLVGSAPLVSRAIYSGTHIDDSTRG